MKMLRVKFHKTGRAKYTSHLDLNRMMQRALRRAEIPVWNTKGFNPHPFITFVLPLSLGCESVCELMDFRLDDGHDMPSEEIAARLNHSLPDGLTIMEVYEPEMKPGSLGFARYGMEFLLEGQTAAEISEKYNALLALPQVSVIKETKHGERSIDLKAELTAAEAQAENGRLLLTITLPAGSQESVSPACVRTAFAQNGLDASLCRTRRLGLLNADGAEFR